MGYNCGISLQIISRSRSGFAPLQTIKSIYDKHRGNNFPPHKWASCHELAQNKYEVPDKTLSSAQGSKKNFLFCIFQKKKKHFYFARCGAPAQSRLRPPGLPLSSFLSHLSSTSSFSYLSSSTSSFSSSLISFKRSSWEFPLSTLSHLHRHPPEPFCLSAILLATPPSSFFSSFFFSSYSTPNNSPSFCNHSYYF